MSFKASKLRIPLLIIGGIVLLAVIILLASKLFTNKGIVYEGDKLYYIELAGDVSITLYQGDAYIEPGYKGTDDEGNDLTDKIIVVDDIDNENIGNYKVTYTLGNITKERNVKVIEKPVGATYIHLYGDINTFLYIGEVYDEKGYAVIDSVDGTKLKDQVKVTSNVDTSKEGIYKVIYSVTNTSGVTTSKERTVIVMDRNLSLIPNNTNITNGNVTINIYARDELFSYLVLPNNVKVTDSVSTYEVSNNGTYKFIMYNTQGESKEKSIEIANIDRESPTGSCSGTYGSGKSNISINAKDNIGISKYVINGNNYTSSNITINEELSSVNITIYDKAGNTKAISCKLNGSGNSSSSSSSSSGSAQSMTPLGVEAGTFLKTDKGLRYYIIIPEGATENMPLVTFLVGGSPQACFNSPGGNIMNAQPTKTILSGKAYSYQKFIYIYPEYTVNNAGSFNKVKELISYIQTEYKCDTQKNIITGHSNGAVGTYYLGYEYPNFFSAVIPLSGPAWSYGPLQSSHQYKAGNLGTATFFGITGVKGLDKNYMYSNGKIVELIHKANPKAKAYYANSNATFSNVIKGELGKAPTNLPNISSYGHPDTPLFYQVPEFWEWMLRQ